MGYSYVNIFIWVRRCTGPKIATNVRNPVATAVRDVRSQIPICEVELYADTSIKRSSFIIAEGLTRSQLTSSVVGFYLSNVDIVTNHIYFAFKLWIVSKQICLKRRQRLHAEMSDAGGVQYI